MVSTNLLAYDKQNVNLSYDIQQGKLSKPVEPIIPQIEGHVTPGKVTIHSTPAEIHIDSYEARSSLGLGHKNTLDFDKAMSQKSQQTYAKDVGKIVSDGNAMYRGTKPAELVRQHKMQEYATAGATVTEFLPKTGAKVSFSKPSFDMTATLNQVSTDWDYLGISKMQYIRGKVDIQAEGYPDVKFTYTGGPLYFPARLAEKFA
jgi:hypothetical protein